MKKSPLVLGGAGIVAAAAIVFVAVSHVSSRADQSAAAAPRPIEVQLARATMQDLEDWFEIGGDVRARQTATLVSRIVAPVTQVLVLPGDRVHAGQPLVLLDARDLTAASSRARAAVEASREAANAAAAERQAADAASVLATATYKRVADLRAKNSATPNELDEALAGLHAAEARVAGARAQIARAAAGIQEAQAASEASSVSRSYATVAAPFDGVVTQKLIEAGNMAAPGVPLLTVEDTRAFRLEVRIDQSRASLVRPGQAVEVAIDDGAPATARSMTGRVAEISHVVDENAHAFLAKIDLPATPAVRSGMFGRARFAGAARRVLAVPAASVVRQGQLTSVFVVDGSGIARLRLVSVGEPSAGAIEVRAGLDPDEIVVVDPPPGLIDGAAVAAPRAGGRESTRGGRA
jgi:RND family efflux transporter MFP subunit